MRPRFPRSRFQPAVGATGREGMAGRNQPSVDNSRQLGLYPNGGAAPQQPLSGPHVQSPQAYYQAVGASQAPPAQPMSAPHPSHAGHSDNRQSGSRYASNPTREAIAQLIEGSGGKELRSRSNSAGSMSDRYAAPSVPLQSCCAWHRLPCHSTWATCRTTFLLCPQCLKHAPTAP